MYVSKEIELYLKNRINKLCLQKSHNVLIRKICKSALLYLKLECVKRKKLKRQCCIQRKESKMLQYTNKRNYIAITRL